MIFAGLIAHIRARLAKRAKYRRLVAEIRSLSENDLADLRADRGDLLREVHREIYA